MARPKKPDEKRRGYTLRVRLTESERKIFEEAAERNGLELSGWVRMVLLKAARKK